MYLVSKAWNELLKSEQFYNMRARMNLVDTLLLAISEDSQTELSSKQLLAFDLKHKLRCKFPSPSRELQRHLLFTGYKCIAVGCLFFILGGAFSDEFGLHGQRTVTIFNTAKNMWYEGASMNIARSYFACGVIDGLLYVVGGYNCTGEVEISGEVYNVKKNAWSEIAPMPYGLTNIESDAVFQGRLFVKGRTSTGADDERKVLAYDPCSNLWEVKEELESNLLDGEFAATSNDLYVLNRSGYIGKYNCASAQWQQVGNISLYFFPFDCPSKRAIVFGKDVFFLNGLSGEPLDLYRCKNFHQVLPKVFWQWQGAIVDA
ncbi:hypothetical protein O6H91_03G074800 [Diphasiastrum complanatum]|nr:hypothetical protein O6H91_03G074800 [Diphasiastrum complanatum]